MSTLAPISTLAASADRLRSFTPSPTSKASTPRSANCSSNAAPTSPSVPASPATTNVPARSSTSPRRSTPRSSRCAKLMTMETITYEWTVGTGYSLHLVHVPGTLGKPYSFGHGDAVRSIGLEDFFIGTTPVTQALWMHVMGDNSNPAIRRGADLPVENVSWNRITQPGGFLDCI